MDQPQSVSVTLLGSPQILVGDRPAEVPKKAHALLALLLADPERWHKRNDLAAMLWPQSGHRSARHSLSQLLYVVKKALGEAALVSDVESVRAGRVRSDILAFRAAVRGGSWKQAGRAYSGTFALGLEVGPSVAFEHWLDEQRADLAKWAQMTVEQLQIHGQTEEARKLAEVLVRADPTNLAMVRAVVQARFETSGSQSANEYADSLAAPGSQVAREAIVDLQRSTTGALPDVVESGFVGRKEAMRWLASRYDDVLSGATVAAVIEGEPGIGKTALVDRFSRLLVIRGARVLTAAAYLPEQNVPFGVVGQWLQAIPARYIKALSGQPWMEVVESYFPDMNGAFEPKTGLDFGTAGHHRILESVRRLLVELSQVQPLSIVVDDIQWADPASLSFLHYALRRSESVPIFVVATLRSLDESASAAFIGWRKVDRMSLSGLGVDEILQLAGRYEGINTEDIDVHYLQSQTAGNPLLLTILLQEYSRGSDQTAGPPQSIVQFLRPRLEQTSRKAREFLGALSLMGEPSELARVNAVAGLTDADARDVVAELDDARLVTRSGGKFALRHGLVGEVALSLFPATDKQALHGRAARQLALGGAPPTTLLAVSHDIAGNRTDAFEASLRASQACDVLQARSEKEYFLKLALSNAPAASNEAQVRIDLAELHIQQGRPNDALGILDGGNFGDLPPTLRTRADATRLRAMVEMTGDIDVLNDLWERAQAIGRDSPALSVATMYADVAGVAHELGLDGLAARIAQRVEKQLAALPLTVGIARQLLRLTTIIGLHQGYRVALEKLLTLPAPEDKDPTYAASYYATKATILVASGSLTEAEACFASSLGITERYALFDHCYTVNNNLGVCLMEQGKHAEARRFLETAIEYAAADVSPSHHSTAWDNLTTLAYEEKRYHRALELGKSLLEARKVSGARTTMSLLAIVGLSGLETGNLRSCREAERELTILTKRHGEFANDLSYAHVFLNRILAMRGESASAIDRLSVAAERYRNRNLLARTRIELEQCRLESKAGRDCTDMIERILEELHGTGAGPLLDRAQGLQARLRLRDD